MIDIQRKILSLAIDENSNFGYLKREQFTDEVSLSLYDSLKELFDKSIRFSHDTIYDLISIGSISISQSDFDSIALLPVEQDNFKQYYDWLQIDEFKRNFPGYANKLLKKKYSDIEDLTSDILNLITEEMKIDDEIKTSKQLMPEVVADYENKVKTITPSSIEYFDETQGGFNNTDLVILAARPSNGKTSYALEMAINQLKLGMKVGFLTMEYDSKLLMTKFACSKAHVNFNNYRRKMFNPIDKEKFARASDWLYQKPLKVTAGIDSWEKMRSKLEKMDCDIYYIDFFQKIRPKNGKDMTSGLEEIAKDLKNMCINIKSPIVLLAQLSKAHVTQGREPEPYDIKWTTGAEESADIVIMIHPIGDEGSIIKTNKMKVGKNRDGLEKEYYLQCDPRINKWYPYKENELNGGIL